MSAGSKMNPLLAKAEAISGGGRASVIMYLKRRKKITMQLQPERGVRTPETTLPTDFSIVLMSFVVWRQGTGVLSSPLCSGGTLQICVNCSVEVICTLCEFQLPFI